jgi:uncharacterized membrane protein YeaQ/YmgE (transglycosylase-associated protein family)
MFGAVITGFIVGVIARALTPGDVFSGMAGPTSWLASIAVGLGGSLLGYLVFTAGLGIGDDDVVDLGGIVGAVTGAVVVLLLAGLVMRGRTRP